MDKIDYKTFKNKYGYKNVPIWSYYYKYFKRPITMPLCWLIYKTTLKPDQLTILGLVFSILSALFFSTGNKIGLLMGFVFFELFHFADDFDGVIARSKNLRSKRGAWFDAIAGVVGATIILIGISMGVFLENPNQITFLAGLFAVFGIVSYSLIDVEAMLHFVEGGFKKKEFSIEESSLVNLNKIKAGKLFLEFLDSSWHFFLMFSAIFGVMQIYIIISSVYYPTISLLSFLYKYQAHKKA